MRLVFFLVVLAAYVALVPPGKPDVNVFDGDTVALEQAARELQRAWVENSGADLLKLCADEGRPQALQALLGMAARDEGESVLSEGQADQLKDFSRRVATLEKPSAGARTVDDTLRHQAAEEALCMEIVAWMRANGRVPERIRRILRNTPQITRFASPSRGLVQYCSRDRRESNLDPLVAFDRVGGRWTWAFDRP